MIDLNNYKNYLINNYHYKIDNSLEKRAQRRVYLDTYYPDEYLSKIVDDSYSFIKDIFNDPSLEKGYISYEVEEDTTKYISLNLVGGYHSDTLYTDNNDRTISKYILKKTFGSSLIVDIKEDLHEFDTGDEDLISFDHRYSLYLQGFPNNMEEIKRDFFSNKVLKKK